VKFRTITKATTKPNLNGKRNLKGYAATSVLVQFGP